MNLSSLIVTDYKKPDQILDFHIAAWTEFVSCGRNIDYCEVVNKFVEDPNWDFRVSAYRGKGWPENKPGVYLIRSIYNVLYIGSSDNIRRRVKQHGHRNTSSKFIDKCNNCDETPTEIYIWYTKRHREVEKKLIQRFNPLFNIHHNTNI